MARTGVFLIALLAASAGLVAFEPVLSPRSLSDAIDIGQSRMEEGRSRFHAAYHVTVAQPPVDYIEVITPFRRVALDAEAHAHAGERLYGQREALALLGSDPARVDIVAELTFHPMNNFVGIPNYSVSLLPVAGGPRMLPQQSSRLPRFGPRLSGTPLPYPYSVAPPAPNGSQPLLGGSLIATFDGQALDSKGEYWAIVSDSDEELARARVDFSKQR